jgi:hypothetical protein
VVEKKKEIEMLATVFKGARDDCLPQRPMTIALINEILNEIYGGLPPCDGREIIVEIWKRGIGGNDEN